MELKDDSSSYLKLLISGWGTNTCGIRESTSKENAPSVKNEVKLSSPNMKDKQRKKCFVLNPTILDAHMCSQSQVQKLSL